MAIYLVDEDHFKLYSWILELEFRGMDVITISDADRAFATLSTASDIELAIIDVMLASADSDSQYRAERTDQGLTTGLVLLQDLCSIRPDIFPARALLLTAASTQAILGPVQNTISNTGVRICFKNDIESPRHFGDVIEHARRVPDAENESLR